MKINVRATQNKQTQFLSNKFNSSNVLFILFEWSQMANVDNSLLPENLFNNLIDISCQRLFIVESYCFYHRRR